MPAQLIIDPEKVEIHFNDTRMEQGRNQKEIQATILEGVIIRAYVKAEISLGEVAELTGQSVEEAMDWLNDLGVNTSRKFRPETQALVKGNTDKLAAQLGIKLPS